MNKNTIVLKENLTKNGFSISVPKDDFIVVESPFKRKDILKEFFIRCHGSRVLVFSMVRIDDILQDSAEIRDLAFVLSSEIIMHLMKKHKNKIEVKENDLVFSAIINSYPIFPFMSFIYPKTYDRIINISLLFDTVVDELRSQISFRNLTKSFK